MHTILKYSSEVIGELQQMNGQLQADESKEMMQKLRKLNVETSLLKVNALENLEN